MRERATRESVGEKKNGWEIGIEDKKNTGKWIRRIDRNEEDSV